MFMMLQMQQQQAIMQRQVEMQLRGAEAQVKGQNKVMVRLLKEIRARREGEESKEEEDDS
jgi:hypothetical protein